jgi:hypothetical protein
MSECYYSVGKTQDNQIVLKIGTDMVSTLTMTEYATVQLIRLLGATLEEYTVKVTTPTQVNEDNIQEWIQANRSYMRNTDG